MCTAKALPVALTQFHGTAYSVDASRSVQRALPALNADGTQLLMVRHRCMREQVGLWAQKHLPDMDLPALAAFSEVLGEENPGLFKWLTGQEEPSPAMAANPSFLVSRLEMSREAT